MMKTQTKISRWRRFFRWFGHHKVQAVFAVIICACVLYFGVSEIVWRVQVHEERERYNKASQMINEVTDNLKIPQPPTRIERSKFCTHSNFGGIFETDSITCDVDIELQYSGTQVVGSSQALEQIKTFLINRGITTKLNSNNESSQNLGLYDFEYQNLGCFSQASYNRNADGSTANQSFSIEMDCGGKAKVDYFPVVKD